MKGEEEVGEEEVTDVQTSACYGSNSQLEKQIVSNVLCAS